MPSKCKRLLPSAFTLIELLVVIGIVSLLIGLVLVVSTKARGSADRARLAAELQTISIALENYKQDFGDYPRLQPNITPNGTPASIHGAQLLCWALIAPAAQNLDGAGDSGNGTNPGFGFRTRPGGQGKVYGPYIPAEKFRIASQASVAGGGNPVPAHDNTDVILDYTGNPILYFTAALRKPNINGTLKFNGVVDVPGYVARSSLGLNTATVMLYDADQCVYLDNAHRGVLTKGNLPAFLRTGESDKDLALNRMRVMLGDTGDPARPKPAFWPPNGVIDPPNPPAEFPGDDALPTAPFLLWCAGDDELFGPTNPANPSDRKSCDDVINVQ